MSETGRIPQPGDVLGGKYDVEDVLGQGGMGVVLAARNRRTNRRVAIKWLLPRLVDNQSALKRFEREAQVAGSIEHPNVVNVYDVERDGQTTYIVMELLDGQSLAQRLSGRPCMPLSAVAKIFMPVLRGVAAAHAAGVVHRDLKPDNVFLCRAKDGSPEVPKVLDFGISKIAEREHTATTLTQDGALLGTFQYMSPEQLRGHDTDQRTDVFALGVILYRMLSAELPFRGNNAIDLALNIASSLPAPLSRRVANLPPGLDAVVSKALARDVGERFGSVEELAHALEPYFIGHLFRVGETGSGVLSARAPSPPLSKQKESVEATPFTSGNRPRTAVTTVRWSSRKSALLAIVAAAAGLVLWLARIPDSPSRQQVAPQSAPIALEAPKEPPTGAPPSPTRGPAAAAGEPPTEPAPTQPAAGWLKVASSPAGAEQPDAGLSPSPAAKLGTSANGPAVPPGEPTPLKAASKPKHRSSLHPSQVAVPGTPAPIPSNANAGGEKRWMDL